MIIESLHSTQSSDMSENMQTEKAAHCSHEAGFKGQMRLVDTSARSRRTGADTKQQTARSDTGDDSDSDDSVDRGIEEAIQEYLKEKVDHKRKGDPMTSSPPAPKLQRREPTVSDAARHHTHSSSAKVLTASNHIQRALSGTQSLKKKVKKKKLSKENPVKKADTSKVLSVKSLPLPRAKKGSSSSSEIDRSPPRLVIKEEEEWLDSSSDDGIEEEIQRFQQEKKEKQEGEKDVLRSSQQREDSESSSDEGIEEAIRRFQEEKHKQKNKKSPLKPAQLVSAQRNKPVVNSPECMSTQPFKALSKKSKKLTTKKSKLPTPLGVSHFLNKYKTQSSKVKGCTPPLSNPKPIHTEHQIHSSLKVNTAELMCAEAILDISKTVMPEVFESNLDIANRNLLQTPTFPTVATSVDKSDESSVDSEDGIEQEIRKFLEHKAKMNKELPSTTEVPPPPSGDPTASKEPKKKMKETQSNKADRLSLSKKRKFKEEQSKLSRDGDLVLNVKEEPPGTPLIHSDSTRPEHSTTSTVMSHSSSPTTLKNRKPKQNSPLHKGMDSSTPKEKGSSSSMSSPKTVVGSERNDSSDKSSSLDSDEDLDAAIKDLLKTKKKVKKKVRDMKARKSTKPSEASSLDAVKKQKPFTEQKSILPCKLASKSGILKGDKETLNVQTKNYKGHKSKAVKGKPEVHNIKQSRSPAQANKVTGNGGVPKPKDVDVPTSGPHPEEDDSSVDSDDSIEQEIRRFLAEKAKESTPLATNTKQEEECVGSLTSSAECDVKPELQKIQIETPISASPSTSARLFKTETQAESIGTPARSVDAPAELNKGPVLTPGSSCIMGFRRTESQKFEISTPRDPKNGSSQIGKDSPTSHAIKPNSFTMPSASSDTPRSSGHQHQNLFLMRPINSSMTDVKELSSTDGNELSVSRQSRPASRIPLKDVISSLCPSPISKPQISFSGVTPSDLSTSAPNGGRTGLYLHNRLKRDRHPSDRPHLSTTHQGSSVIQLQRDQAAFPTPLAKTNHLQVSQTEVTESTASLGVRQREGGSVSKEENKQEDEEEKCVDETDVESDEERKDQKTKDRRKQPQNQSLSTSIDPGLLLSPYIALDTEERSLKFQTRRQLIQKQLEGSKTAKRRLQFVVSFTR
ncbi:hypothetical protein Q8A67_022260 [Cirrhinus molitorella]|uniref:Protein phosphatase 1 regulatory subunit 26 N-terminal domain-containing protein n=1 Tax=Cirrhinus molitorella TaxID=172907 RepID=A0AA88PFD0_9TELE|nr:hypothetical protein Q8A67_022260 [Cirrhinus molitorella]